MNLTCEQCNKPLATAVSVAFDKFPGRLEPGKSFGICECATNNERRNKQREVHH